MDHFVGLDVSVKETSVCILDDAGRIVREVKVASEPQALLKVMNTRTPYRLILSTSRARIGFSGALYVFRSKRADRITPATIRLPTRG
jgi:predicted NBD/HSP70 family sugar kinase